MKYNQIFFSLFLILTVASARAEKSEAEIRSDIQNQVNQRHPSLPSGFWEGLGAGALPIIKKMYQESDQPYERTFLIDGLSHFSDPDTGRFLQNEVQSTQNEVLKKKLLSAVVTSQGAQAFEFVEPYLSDSDAHIRMTVAKELLVYADQEKIRKRLEVFKSQEKTAWVLTEVQKKAVQVANTHVASPLQRTRHQIEVRPNGSVLAKKKSLEALSEKNWAGVWRGSFLSETKMILVDANLILSDSSTSPMKWKVEFKLPKGIKQEWKKDEFTVHYFQTDQAHWLELRNQKLDTVFLSQRKAK